MAFDNMRFAPLAAWLGLPAGVALSSTLGDTIARVVAPPVWAAALKAPLLHLSAEGVMGATSALVLPLTPLALMPLVRALQRDETLPGWASAPVGLAVAGVGIGHYVGLVRTLVLNGTAMPLALDQVGFAPMAAAIAAAVVGAVVAATPPTAKPGKGKVRRDPNGPWRSDFWAMKEARAFLSQKDGLVLGEACVPATEPERVGIAALLRWLPKGHLLTVAGSGAGKGVAVVVPNCLVWGGPLVVHDPAGETLAIVRAHREALGRKVRVISLEPDSDGANALAWLDPGSKNFSVDVRTVVSWLARSGEDGKADNDPFAGMAQSLCVALIMFVLCSDAVPPPEKHLLKVRQLGASPDLRNLLKTMVGMKNVANGALAAAAGLVVTTMDSDETYAGVAMNFDNLTASLEGCEAILCGQVVDERKFAITDILDGQTDVFICLPADMLRSQPQIARVLLGGMATAFLRKKSRATHDTLFIVDEMPLLGKMEVLETVRDFGRKFGLFLWPIVQDLGQLEKAYGKTGVRSWLATPAVLQLFAVNDLETADMAAKRSGDFTAVQESESVSKGHTRSGSSNSASKTINENNQPTRTALISADEVMSLAVDEDGQPEEQLLFIRGRRPLRCGLVKYYRRKEMACLVQDNPFFRPSTSKASKGWSRRHAATGAYGAVLLGVAAGAALAPLPLTAGDEAVVVGDQAVPVYWPAGGQAGTVTAGWPVRVVSLNRRDDGYVEVLGNGGNGAPVRVLVQGAALARP